MSRGSIRLGTALALVVALVSVGGAAAQTTVRSEVDARRVGVQDAIQLTITVEGSSLPNQIAMPPLTNLRVVGGPSVSTQMSFVNGRTSQARSWTYTLQPNTVGHAEVGTVRVPTEAGETTAAAIPIDVVAGAVKPRAPARRDPFGEDPFGGAFGRGRATEPQLRVEANPNRSSVYVGEPVLLTYYLDTQVSVSGLQFAEAPQFTGFWVEDLERPANGGGAPVTVDGVQYRRFPVMMKLLYPTKAGRLTLPASTLSIAVQRQSFFDAGGVVQRSTKPVTIEVKPIPEEPGFSGAVGHFKASTTVDRPSIALGDAATVRFRVEGTGNLKWVDRAPELTVPGAKVYPPQVKSDFHASATGITGSRTWEYVVVPQTAGTLEIPSLAFSYFDPTARRLAHSTTAALPIAVAPGGPGAPVPVRAPAGAIARSGALPLRVDLETGASRALAWSGRAVAAIAGIALVLHGLLWGAGGLGRMLRGGPRRAGAAPNLRRALADLSRVGRDGMSKEAAAGLIEKTLHGVFGAVDGADDERARVVRALLDDVHAVRYAPQLGDYSERLRELAARASEVVRRWA
jgi:hypothetical protein